MNRTVTTLYDSPTKAHMALDRLLSSGFDRDDISLVMNEETREQAFPDEKKHKTGSGAAAGAGIGALIGGLVALASLGIPGGILVAGPLAAFLGGAGAGVVGGGIVGALVGAGVPKDEAKHWESRIQRGDVLIAVEARDDRRAEQAVRIMQESGAPRQPWTGNLSYSTGGTR